MAANELVTIAKTVQDYFDGMHHGDTGKLRKVFHPDAHLFGYYHEEFSRISLEEWMAEVQAMDKPSATGEVFDMRLVSIDVTGPTAAVKVALLYAGVRYTDYLALMRFDSDWKIVNKVYNPD